MARIKSMVRLEAHQKVIELGTAEQLSLQVLHDVKQQLGAMGFKFDSDPEEAWLRGFASDDFVLLHRRLPLALTSSQMAAKVLSSQVQVLKVSEYSALELSLTPESLEALNWHAEIYPADPDGIDLARLSADELFYATV